MALVNNQMALNTVYNYFLTTYAPETKNSSRYDTHKKSELRNVYNSIVRQSKESPLYILDTSEESKKFAVGIKESAREFSNTISSLSDTDSDDVLNKKAASSTNTDLVSAKYIGSDDEDISFDISVEKLATTQENAGYYLNANAPVDMAPGNYSFDVHINDTDYEFQFSIAEGDTNKNLQDKLSSLINRSNIGISGFVAEDNEGNSALVMESVATGISEGQDSLFSVSDENTSKNNGVVSYLGIADITSPAANAEFTLNGTSRTAYSNVFTVDKKFEIALKGLTDGESAVTIGLKPDVESMTDNVKQLADSYNGFLDKAAAYEGSNVKTQTFLSDMKKLTNSYRNELDTMGLTFNEDGRMEIDEAKLTESLESEDGQAHIGSVRSFTSALMRKSSQISLNPMDYVQKTVVAYKNPGRSYANPYMTSIYSGMMFNGYC